MVQTRPSANLALVAHRTRTLLAGIVYPVYFWRCALRLSMRCFLLQSAKSVPSEAKPLLTECQDFYPKICEFICFCRQNFIFIYAMAIPKICSGKTSSSFIESKVWVRCCLWPYLLSTYYVLDIRYYHLVRSKSKQQSDDETNISHGSDGLGCASEAQSVRGSRRVRS